tara:strand:+ start:51467 stop:53173 length:1707 start_codon:yes stop_codon:yes gene_type:complete
VIRGLFFICFLSSVIGQTIKVSVNQNQITVNDLLTLSIETEGSNTFPEVDLKPLENNFHIVSGPSQQTNVQWINGGMKNTRSLIWSLSPKKEGSLFIPSLTGKVGNKTFKTKPISILVEKVNNGKKSDAFIVAEIDKVQGYLGEQITLTYKLFASRNINIQPFEIPEFEGFWKENIFSPNSLNFNSAIYNGLDYQMAILSQIALFPISSDKHIIPSLRVNAQIEVKKKNRRRDPFFDPFFDSFFSQKVNKVLTSQKLYFKVLKFPRPIPVDYNGAVGSFYIEAKIDDQDSIKINEGFTYTISLKGTGNLGLFSLPEITFPEKLEVFSPTENFSKDAFRDELTGIQTWEYILIPRSAGKVIIPRLNVSYFNPKLKKWLKTETEEIKINIYEPNNVKYDNSGFTKKEIELIGEDIRFIHTKDSSFSRIGTNWIPSSIYIFYAVSISIFIFPLIRKKTTGYKSKNSRIHFKRKALKIALKDLKATNNDPFNVASRSIYFYLKNKLSLDSHNLDPTRVDELISDRLTKDDKKNLIELLKVCDAGQFAPGGKKRESTIIVEAKFILKKVDELL